MAHTNRDENLEFSVGIPRLPHSLLSLSSLVASIYFKKHGLTDKRVSISFLNSLSEAGSFYSYTCD